MDCELQEHQSSATLSWNILCSSEASQVEAHQPDMWSMWCMLGNPPCLYCSCLLWLFSKWIWPPLKVQGIERNPHKDTKQMASPLLYILYSLLILNSFHCFSPYGHHCCDMLMIKHLKPVLQRLKDWCEQAICLEMCFHLLFKGCCVTKQSSDELHQTQLICTGYKSTKSSVDSCALA